MCGIVGIAYPENKETVDASLLRKMNTSLRHRGPDDEGYWVRPEIGLGMRRLSIIDLEGGRQPIGNEDETIWTVANGEIYNFRQLREELIQKGHRFKSRTDTEVIVHLYEDAGEEFVQKLRGMFAIALWDGRSRKLLLYRDRVGIKPLHYWFREGSLLFASEIKALLEHPAVGRELSLGALKDYLNYLYIPAPRTIYREIQKLPAGHFLRYSKGEIQIERYWDFSYEVRTGRSEEEWAEALREALQESVKMHLVSDVPLGAFLSGGADSSSVVALMSRGGASPVKTYSIGVKDDRFNELPFARQVARHSGTDHHEKFVEVDAFRLIPKILAGFDEPFGDSSALPTFLVSEFARREVTVALSGDGGDELFGGYLWTRKEVLLENFRRWPQLLRSALEKLFLGGDYRPLQETTSWSILRRFLYDARLSPGASYARRSMSFQPWMTERLFQPWVRESLRGEDPFQVVDSFLKNGKPLSALDQFLYLDSKIYLPDDLLAKVDRMSMLHSLEVRVPLLDHKVIELAGSIPFSLKIKGGTTKYILKRAMKGLLPAEILRQRKQGFSIPLQRWFRRELAGFSEKLLLDPKSFSRKYFEAPYLELLLRQHQKGEQRFGTQIYALIIFELWNRLAAPAWGKPAEPNFSLKDLTG